MGYADLERLETSRKALEAVQGNVMDLYVKKTGRDREELQGWMDATSWWTAQEAMDNGFIDEIVEGGNDSYENRAGMLFVNSVSTNIEFKDVPEFVRNRKSGEVNTPDGKEGKNPMDEITTVEALRAAYPDLCNQIATNAATEERQRIHDIDDAMMEGCEELANDAKYTNPVSASAYAMNALKHIRETGRAQLQGMRDDARNSGAGKVPGAVPPAGPQAKADSKKDDLMDALNAIGKSNKR